MEYPTYLVHFNKNHDKLGRFTFGDGDGDGKLGEANPNDYRTPELDKKYEELKKSGATGIEKLKWLHNDDNAEKVWGKEYVESATLGMKGYVSQRGIKDPEIQDFLDGTADNAHKNAILSWFVLEDQTPGYAEIAHMVNKGWSKEKILDMVNLCEYDFSEKNNDFVDAYTGYPDNKEWYKLFDEAFEKEPYPGTYSIGERLENGLEEYIDECIDIKNSAEHSDLSLALMHFNKNHSKDNGQFVSGDGDGDGIIDDHAHRGKKELGFRDKVRIVGGAAGIGFGAWTIYKGYKKGNKFVMALGGVKIALSVYKIAKGAGFVDEIKDRLFPEKEEVEGSEEPEEKENEE